MAGWIEQDLGHARWISGAFFIARYKFPGRRFFLSLAAVPFCLPPILVILAFILYYGKSGWLSDAFRLIGFDGFGESGFLYSLQGLVLVHAFYNFPIVVQNVGAVWTKCPSREERRTSAPKIESFLTGTSYLLPRLLQSASLIFLFCFFQLYHRAGLRRPGRHDARSAPLPGDPIHERQTYGSGARPRPDGHRPVRRKLFRVFRQKKRVYRQGLRQSPPPEEARFRHRRGDSPLHDPYRRFLHCPLCALAAEAFTQRSSLAGPLGFGFGNFTRLLSGPKPTLLLAIANSLAIGGAAALLATVAGTAVAASSHYALVNRARGGLGGRGGGSPLKVGWITLLPLALSPAVVSTGWSSLIRSGSEILIVLGQTAIAWPFVARSLSASFSALDRSKNEAARTLGSSSLHALLRVDAATISPSIASAAAFAFSITMGDVNIPLVLGGGRYETLPLLLYRLTSSYRFNEACAVGIVLALFTSVAFFLKEKSNETS